MSKENTDYSNTIIYKIYCKDENIKDLYVGHTTNFIVRKYQHKTCCNNLSNKIKIYETIRNNGGWENWDMVELAKYNCKDIKEARIREQEYYEKLEANLNSVLPYVNKYDFFCDKCDIQFKNQIEYNTHQNNLHNENIQTTNLEEIVLSKFFCEKCDYRTSKKSQYERHLLTDKHKKKHNLSDEKRKFICKCGKKYSHSSTLYAHKRTCKQETPTEKELIMLLIKENSELKNIMVNALKNINVVDNNII